MEEVDILLGKTKSGALSRDERDCVSTNMATVQENVMLTRSCANLLLKLQNTSALINDNTINIQSYDEMLQRFIQKSDIFRIVVKSSYYDNEELKSTNA